jgi:hypothetical protein
MRKCFIQAKTMQATVSRYKEGLEELGAVECTDAVKKTRIPDSLFLLQLNVQNSLTCLFKTDALPNVRRNP